MNEIHMPDQINLTQLREQAEHQGVVQREDGPVITMADWNTVLALIDTAEAAIELDPTLKWIANTYPKAIEEMPTSEYRRFDRLRQTLNRYTTS